jgi:tetratricopeptide (TPR) repeat protein
MNHSFATPARLSRPERMTHQDASSLSSRPAIHNAALQAASIPRALVRAPVPRARGIDAAGKNLVLRRIVRLIRLAAVATTVLGGMAAHSAFAADAGLATGSDGIAAHGTAAPLSTARPGALLLAQAGAAPVDEDDSDPSAVPMPAAGGIAPQRSAGVMSGARTLHATDTVDVPNRALTGQIVFQVLAAEVALQRGQAAPAFQTYLALARSTQDPRMAQRAAEIAVTAQSPNDALTAARLWHQYAPHSDQAAQFDATLLILSGYLDEAKPLLARQLATVPDAERGTAIMTLQDLIGRGPDHIGGIRVLRELLQDDMNRPEALTAIGRQQLLSDDQPGARKSFDAALKLKPDFPPAALLLAQISPDARHDAITSVLGFVQQHPKDRDARFLLAQLYLADNQIDPARKQFETLHRSNAADPAPLFALGLLSMQLKQQGEAEKYFTQYADQAAKLNAAAKSAAPQNGANSPNGMLTPHLDGGPAYLYLAQIAAERKDFTAADAWLQKIDVNSTQFVPAQIGRAELLVQQKHYDQADALLSSVQPRTGHEAVALGRADAGVLMQSGKYDQAEQRLSALVQLAPSDPDLAYDYAMAAERNAHYPLMETQLRRVIALDPTNAQAYNALGYSLADRGVRLEEADKLVQKAMSLAPGDPYITDSAGWVKYKLGDKDQAVTLLRRAYQIQPNAEIGAHLAEVLWSQGKQDDARQVLRSAQQLDPTNDTLLGVMSRLKVTIE